MSGNLVILRRRIRTVRNTQKLTKAMKTVAAAKLRRAASDLAKTKPYMEKLHLLLQEVSGRLPAQEVHPLLLSREKGIIVLVVVTGDKGLCGAFNSHIIHLAEARYNELRQKGADASFITIGNKGFRYLNKFHFPVKKHYPSMMARLNYPTVLQLSIDLQEIYANEEIAAVELIYTAFESASRQKAGVATLFPLPLKRSSLNEEEDATILEPDARSLFELLLPRYVHSLIYRMLLGSAASEEASRMVAMDLATRNASDMIRDLQLLLNKLRQAAITKELLEIMTATEALKK